jgi:hypothetical protein
VCGAIHHAAGPELEAACAKVAPCPTGEARLTPGFHLPARFVIHAVGPVWQGGQSGEPALLASAYRLSMELARAHRLESIAFPAISTGIYGYGFLPMLPYQPLRSTPSTASKCSSRLRIGSRCCSARAAIQASFAGIRRPRKDADAGIDETPDDDEEWEDTIEEEGW